MKSENALEDIRLIKEMIEQTKRSNATYGGYFIGWGILVIIAVLVNYALIYWQRFNLIWVDWIVFMGVGTIVSIFDSKKKAERERVRTYTAKALSHLWAGCGMAFILVGFVFPLLGLYSYEAIPALVSLVAGVGMFVSGGMYEWPLLKWAGIVWWLGSIGLVFAHGLVQALLLCLLVLAGYLYPGIRLNLLYRKEGERHATENA